MKQLAVTLFGTLFGVGLALFLYDHFIVQPREASRVEAAALDLSGAAEQARHITTSVDASVQQSIAGAQQAFDAQAAEQDKRRMAAEALAHTQMYKVALTESFMANGKWPASATGIGMPENNDRLGGAVRNITVGERGTVTVTFDNHFAEGARFQLVPQADPDTYQVRWQCRTSGDPDLKRYLPSCSSS